jgi:hypothetical protein
MCVNVRPCVEHSMCLSVCVPWWSFDCPAIIMVFSLYLTFFNRLLIYRTDVKRRWKRNDFTVKLTRIIRSFSSNNKMCVLCFECYIDIPYLQRVSYVLTLRSEDGGVNMPSRCVCILTLLFCVSVLIMVGGKCSQFIENWYILINNLLLY